MVALVTSLQLVPRARGREHRNWWKAALGEAKVQDFHWHDLRHSFASRPVQRGVDIYTVKEQMGHAVISVTMRYAHLAPSHLHAAVERIGSVAKSVASEMSVSSVIQ